MMELVKRILAAHEEIATRSLLMSVRRANKLVDDSEALVKEAMRDPQALGELLQVLDTTKDVDLKDWLRPRVLPETSPRLTDADEFRAHPLVALTAKEMPIRPSLALVEVKGSIKDRALFDEEEPDDLSWFTGRPAAEDDQEWPTADDGFPHAHIIQIDLGFLWPPSEVTSTMLEELDLRDGGVLQLLHTLGFPKSGVLQVFHDLETSGWDTAEKPGWCVRWVQNPTRLLQRPPMDQGSYRKPRAMKVTPAKSVPSAILFSGDADAWERYERAAIHIEDTLRSPFNQGKIKTDRRPTVWESHHQPEFPTSRIGGFGHHPWNEELEEVLTAALPLTSADDEYFLLFDIAGVRHLEDWFGDCGHLQVWIRHSDLAAHHFDRVWCVIRTD
ncbi:DUF1963 domain-containing protein [Tessaracoccus caeni]|uniref:DUF1963 domain-containing protein n=1 Tax=Tessaracoccus caeni TaxID=3031239 RepID=UPI0023DCA0EE|nr:DUF1963 domain-containing protein [Tessaracoccus caeni]MDF1487801.1 DUF1963 domain-containing protein [Tessaracoccus caeni]